MVRMVVVVAYSLAFFRDCTGQVGLRRSVCREEEFCGNYNREDANAMAAAFACS